MVLVYTYIYIHTSIYVYKEREREGGTEMMMMTLLLMSLLVSRRTSSCSWCWWMTTRLIRNAQKRQELVTSEDGDLTQLGLENPSSHVPHLKCQNFPHNSRQTRNLSPFLQPRRPWRVIFTTSSSWSRKQRLAPSWPNSSTAKKVSPCRPQWFGDQLMILSETKCFHRSGLYIHLRKKGMVLMFEDYLMI